MLFMHEVHRVKGAEAYAFEAMYREQWPRLVAGCGARLLWYFNLAHGASVSYNVVTITAFNDWPAWEGFARSVQSGALRDWAHEADALRYGVRGTMLVPLPWSPPVELDLERVPVETADDAAHLFIEDTLTPDRGPMDSHVASVERLYPKADGGATGPRLSELVGAFRPAAAGGRRRQIVLLQRVLDWDALARLYATGAATEGSPWSVRHDEAPFTDRTETRLLRTAPWSPLH